MRPALSLSLLLVALSSLSCLGYRFGTGASLPKGVSAITVPAFVDATAEGGLGAEVAAATREHLRALDPRLVAGFGDAKAARIVGQIDRIGQATVPMGRGGGVVAGLYRVELYARARLLSPSGALIKDLGKFREAAEFPAESGVQASESSRRRALFRAAQGLGKRIAEAAVLAN